MYDKPIYWLNELRQDANDYAGGKFKKKSEQIREMITARKSLQIFKTFSTLSIQNDETGGKDIILSSIPKEPSDENQ